MAKKNFQKWIIDNNACVEVKNFAKNKTLSQVWKTCHRPDWMMWIYKRSKLLDKIICVKIAIISAELVLNIYENKYRNDDRPRKAIQSAKDYLKNQSAEYISAAYAAASAACAASADINKQVCDYIRSLVVLPIL